MLGSEDSGVSVYELPPGQAVCPYHYEVGEEEWLLVLAGNPTLRHPDGSERLDPWDVVRFPKGPAGAHGIRNETDEPVRIRRRGLSDGRRKFASRDFSSRGALVPSVSEVRPLNLHPPAAPDAALPKPRGAHR